MKTKPKPRRYRNWCAVVSGRGSRQQLEFVASSRQEAEAYADIRGLAGTPMKVQRLECIQGMSGITLAPRRKAKTA